VDWIHLAEAFVNMVMNLRVPNFAGNFLAVSLWRRAVRHGGRLCTREMTVMKVCGETQKVMGITLCQSCGNRKETRADDTVSSEMSPNPDKKPAITHRLRLDTHTASLAQVSYFLILYSLFNSM
jgi:hypothetical protein